MKHIGQKILEARTSRGWTQRQLSAKTGLSIQHIGNIEKGRGNPSAKAVRVFESAFGIKLEEA